MKVFISWSGKRSKALANALKEWIPYIVQHADRPCCTDPSIVRARRLTNCTGKGKLKLC